jgi:hypothetical protein
MSFKVPEEYRDPNYSDASDGNNGLFRVPGRTPRERLTVIASDGGGWDHVSVSTPYRCPTWDEMAKIKELFWSDPEDWAVQYHPPMSRYVNNHSYCLHLWRPTHCGEMPFPPDWMVGNKALGTRHTWLECKP